MNKFQLVKLFVIDEHFRVEPIFKIHSLKNINQITKTLNFLQLC